MANLKNIIVSDTGAVTLPSGTTAQRPTSPVDGDTRYNTDVGSVEYYYKGFWVDARTGAGGITHDGLVCYLNAGLTSSYPRSGTTITDLTGNGRNGTLNGTINYSSSDGGYLYGAPGSYISVTNTDFSTSTHTIFTVAGYNGATRGRITTTNYGNNWLLGHWGGYNGNHYAEGWVTGTNDTANGNTSTEWGVHVGTGDYANDRWAYFKNGIVRARNASGSQGPTGIHIGSWGASNEQSDWKWSILLIYNRVLSDEEILKTTMAIRLRNGI